MPDAVLCERSDGVATVTLNRPDRMNTMNSQLLDELLETMESVADDDDVRVVVLTGEGRAFCAGGDLQAMPTGGDSLDAQIQELARQQRSSLLLHEMPKVTIAAVNGACAGAGLTLACAADLRISASSAVFRTAFLSAGMPGDFGGTWSLPRLLGESRARELYLLNEKLTADRAQELGLVARVYEDDEFSDRVTEVARSLIATPPLTLRAMKQNLNGNPSLPFQEALAREAKEQVTIANTDDAAEAWAAFLEKRTPVFQGR